MTYRGQWTVERAEQDLRMDYSQSDEVDWMREHGRNLIAECYRLRRERETWQRIACEHLDTINAISKLLAQVKPGIQPRAKRTVDPHLKECILVSRAANLQNSRKESIP